MPEENITETELIDQDLFFSTRPSAEAIADLKSKHQQEGSHLYLINFGSDEPRYVIIRRVNSRIYREWQQNVANSMVEIDQGKNMLSFFIVYPQMLDSIYDAMLPGEIDNLIQIISEKHGYVQYPIIEKL